MVKFSSVDDNGFKRLLGELIRWESQIRNSAASQPTRSIEGARIKEPANSSFNNYGPGDQFNAPGGTQNISKGIGNQFPGATFSGTAIWLRYPRGALSMSPEPKLVKVSPSDPSLGTDGSIFDFFSIASRNPFTHSELADEWPPCSGFVQELATLCVPIRRYCRNYTTHRLHLRYAIPHHTGRSLRLNMQMLSCRQPTEIHMALLRDNQRSLFHSSTPLLLALLLTVLRRLSRQLEQLWRILNMSRSRGHEVGGDTRNNIGVEFPLFASVLFFQSDFILLTYILAAEAFDFIYNI